VDKVSIEKMYIIRRKITHFKEIDKYIGQRFKREICALIRVFRSSCFLRNEFLFSKHPIQYSRAAIPRRLVHVPFKRARMHEAVFIAINNACDNK